MLAHLGASLALAVGLLSLGAPKPNGPGPAKSNAGDRGGPNAPGDDAEPQGKKKPNRPATAPKGAVPRTPTFGPDGSRLPTMGHPTVHVRTRPPKPALAGWAAEIQTPRLVDHRRRPALVPIPEPFGHTVRVGEKLRFDVEFAGNPAGTVEAWVAAREPDPRGPPPLGSDTFRVETKAVTSGVVSMLTEITVRMTSWLDHHTGAAVKNVYVDDRKGLGAKFAHRTMELFFEGRGGARVVDNVDGSTRTMSHDAPDDALDVLSAMAWVRSLDLQPGERATAHVIDGKVLLRLDVVGGGPRPLDPWPSLATALNVDADGVRMLEGTLTRVDNADDPIPGKRAYQFRTWLTKDDRRLVLRVESDMWLGITRLTLVGYDPPHSGPPPGAEGARGEASAQGSGE